MNLDFLERAAEQTKASKFIDDINGKLQEMYRLQARVFAAQAALAEAQEKYERYKATVVVTAMANAGVSEIADEEGRKVRLETKYYCNPNKNDRDRQLIAQWLEQHGGGFLIKRKAEVASDQLELLKANEIPFAEKKDINTLSLKAFLCSQLGLKGGVATIKQEDIPECMHFVTQFDVVSE